MKISGNTILITGGASGIGLELATQLLALDNIVIITGRDQSKLDLAIKALPGVNTFQTDVSDSKSIVLLHKKVIAEFPALNILINNAGTMHKINFNHDQSGLDNITDEIEINLKAPIRMVKQFLPHLKNQRNSAIINVTSGLAFVPLPMAPIYCATKAALHSFTQSLRVQLKDTNVKVFELAPPAVDTLAFRSMNTPKEIKTLNPMDPHALVKKAIHGIGRDVYEIRPGLSNILKMMSRIAPEFMLKQLSKV